MIVGGSADAGGGNLTNSISDILNMLNLMVANQLRVQPGGPLEGPQLPGQE
jgi:hypothetical protein